MKKNILIIICTLIIISCSTYFYINKDNIINLVNDINLIRDFNTNHILKNDKTVISFSETTDNYISFSIKNNNDSGENYYLNAFFTLTKITDVYNGKTVVAVIEKSNNNSNFDSIGEINLSLNNKVNLITDHLLTPGDNYYRVSFKIDNQVINIKADNILGKLDVKTNLEFKFDYQGKQQEFIAPVTGEYRIELWGASGNAYNNTHGVISGKGAYTAGTIDLKKDTKLYIYTGQNSTNGTDWNEASYGGGGKGGIDVSEPNVGNKHFGASGGGATDVRLISGSWDDVEGLRSRIMVVAGGGGALYKTLNGVYLSGCSGTGGSAGGLVGYQGQISYIGLSANINDEKAREYLNNIISRYPKGGRQTSGGAIGICRNDSYYDVQEAADPTYHCASLVMNPGTFAAGGAAMRAKKTAERPNGIGSSLAAGGGGGYYGGAGNSQAITTNEEFEYFAEFYDVNLPGHTSGAGGASYISGHTGSIAITSSTDESPKSGCYEQGDTPDTYVGTTDKLCSIHYSNLSFTDTVMIDGEGYNWSNKREGKVTMPSYNGNSFESGNTGSGAARITLLSESFTAESTWEKTEKEITVVEPIKITVKYIDEYGNEIEDQEIITNKDGKTTYETTLKEINGYKLVEIPQNASGSFPKSDIEVIYKYKKIQLVNVEDTLKQSILYIVLGGVLSIFGLVLYLNNIRVNKI